MIEGIYDWVVGVLAATELERLKARLPEDRERDKMVQDTERKFLQAVKDFEAAPTSWNAYKEFYDALWIFGHPGQRWNVREFQKLTPEKRQKLEERARASIQWAKEQLERRQKQRGPTFTEATQERIDKVRSMLRPGVKGMSGDEISRKFPIDLSGWKYWTPEFEKRFEDRIRETNRALLERIESRGSPDLFPDIVKELREKVETGKTDWTDITVKLVRKGDKFKGLWRGPMQRELIVVAPYGTEDWALRDLAETVRHEVQHFGQDYLEHALDALFKKWKPGMPSKKIRTPEYTQDLGRDHPGFDPKDPKLREVYRSLRQQGIDPRTVDFHSLDDVEFYTRLADSISFFRQWMKANPNVRQDRDVLNGAIRQYVGGDVPKDIEERIPYMRGSRFFTTLHRRARPKWRKAVAEFIKAVQ